MPKIHHRRFPVTGRGSCQLAADLLRTYYGETGVLDFGLYYTSLKGQEDSNDHFIVMLTVTVHF